MPAGPLADFLFTLRIRTGLSQKEFGAQIGYGQNSISNIETGRQGVSASVLSLWLDACGATPEQRIHALTLARPAAPAGDSAGTL